MEIRVLVVEATLADSAQDFQSTVSSSLLNPGIAPVLYEQELDAPLPNGRGQSVSADRRSHYSFRAPPEIQNAIEQEITLNRVSRKHPATLIDVFDLAVSEWFEAGQPGLEEPSKISLLKGTKDTRSVQMSEGTYRQLSNLSSSRKDASLKPNSINALLFLAVLHRYGEDIEQDSG